MKRLFLYLRSASRHVRTSNYFSCTVAASLPLLAPAVAFANVGAHHEPSIADLKHPWINFFTYGVLLYFVAARPLKAAWSGRTEAIRQSVESAQGELHRAEQQLKGIEESTRRAKERQEEVYKELVMQGEAEAIAIIAEAKNKAQRIAHQGRELIAGESRAAELEMRKEMIAKAEDIARARFASGSLSHRNEAYTEAALKSATRLLN